MLRPVNWVDAWEKARELADRVSATTGCRTLDLLHVAIADLWKCVEFVSSDERQLKAARAAGMAVLHVRGLKG